LTPPGNCVDATCVWGENACSVRQWQNYFAIVLDTFSLLLTAYVFGFGLYVIVAARKNLKMNSMTVTLLSMTLASAFHFLWRMCLFLGYGVLLSGVLPAGVQKSVAIPGVGMCGVIGLLTFPLQWLEVAKKTTRVKTTRGGSSKAPYIAVAVAAFVVSAATIFFAITGQSFLTSGEFSDFEEAGFLHTTLLPIQSNAHFSSTHLFFTRPSFHTALAAGCFFVAIIVYSVGYCKLTGAVGYRNKTVRKLGLLTRNVAICLTFSVLSSLACKYSCTLCLSLFAS
jgi:hypothetical protein